ncbi:MAG: anti-sigma factor [Solirubrobacterales bacterium]
MVELDDITCRELVELVTDYVEGALGPADRKRFEDHLEICEACVDYVEQIRMTIAASGEVSEGTLDSQLRDELLGVFRDWKRGG